MSFLQPGRSRELLLISTLALCFASSPIGVAQDSNQQPVIQAQEIDLAKIEAGGKVVFVSSGQRPAAFHAIDNDRRTVFHFSSSDPRPTLIVKLTENKPIHRVSLVVGSESGRVDIYLLNEMPSDPSQLDKFKPVASIVDPGIAREAVAEFAPQHARYVALRWVFSQNYSRPLAVAEVSVFTNSGSDPNAALVAAADPPPADPVPGPPLIVTVSP